MIQEAIQALIAGADLDRKKARAVMDQIMSGGATDAQIGAFLVALRIKGESVDEIVGWDALDDEEVEMAESGGPS